MNSDFKELLQLFNVNQVEYLVVGGYAYMQYAEPRYTKDIDIWIRATKENASRVYLSLQHFGAPLSKLKPKDFAREGYFYMMGVAPVRVDILMSVAGLAFEDAWKKRVVAYFEEVPVSFLSKEDLITAKLAAGRPQDLLDAEILKTDALPPKAFQKAALQPKKKRSRK